VPLSVMAASIQIDAPSSVDTVDYTFLSNINIKEDRFVPYIPAFIPESISKAYI
jgi:hypothetical protein